MIARLRVAAPVAVVMTVVVAVIVNVIIPDASPVVVAVVAVAPSTIGVLVAMRQQKRRGLRGR